MPACYHAYCKVIHKVSLFVIGVVGGGRTMMSENVDG
jgi:hypothetical protein